MTADILVPLAPIDGDADRDVQNLTGTGSQAIGTALPVGSVGAAIFDTDVRLAFGAAAPTATVTDLYWPAKTLFVWHVEGVTAFVAAIHDDGASAIDGSVWQRGPA